MDDLDLRQRAEAIVERYAARKWKIASAESCTGGLVAGWITEIPGSSAVLERGFVTYSNEAKREMLGVEEAALSAHGAVSEIVARQMAKGALSHAQADVAVSITGIAGPGGGSPEKPVGLVHFACATATSVRHREMRFGDLGRSAIRSASVAVALDLLLAALDDQALDEAETLPTP